MLVVSLKGISCMDFIKDLNWRQMKKIKRDSKCNKQYIKYKAKTKMYIASRNINTKQVLYLNKPVLLCNCLLNCLLWP